MNVCKTINKALGIITIGIASFSVNAQKLPAIQQISLRAPVNVKIDGKPKEWGGQFQAYNNATGIFYTIANDDENLYLVIYSENIDITNKILQNGINISFNAKKKSTEKSLLIKFPTSPSTIEEKKARESEVVSIITNNGGPQSSDEKKPAQRRINKAIAAANKHVGIFGVKAITDTLFSIYDAKGVMVGLNCPEENLLCYELSVPLKYLEITPSSLPKLNYNIRLNEHFLTHVLPPTYFGGTMPGGYDEGAIVHATDFWGEYTLAK